jgi:hypothetical protein
LKIATLEESGASWKKKKEGTVKNKCNKNTNGTYNEYN